MNDTEKIFAFLDENGVPYRAFWHEKTDDLAEKLRHDEEAGITGATHCKNLMLANRQKTRLFLLTMDFSQRFRTGPVSRQMGSGRLNFAQPEVLAEVLHTVPGMVSPLELIFDQEHRVEYSMDKSLKDAALLCFHPGVDTCTVVLENKVFFERLLPLMGVEPNFVDMDLVEE